MKVTIKKHLKTCRTINSIFWGKNFRPFHINKPTFHNYSLYVIIRREQECQSYKTSYCTKIHAVLINVYHTESLDTPEVFRYKLSEFMSGMRRAFAQYIHNRDG